MNSQHTEHRHSCSSGPFSGIPPIGRSFRHTSLLSAVCLLLAFSAYAQTSADTMIHYEVVFEGIPDKTLRSALESVSDTVRLKHEPAAALSIIRGRAERDIPRFVKVLKAQGYYICQAAWHVDPKKTPVLVLFRIDTGPLYLIKSVDIRTPDGAETGPADPKEIGLAVGEAARSDPVLKSQKELLRWFGREGNAFASVLEREVVVDHAAQSVTISYLVEPGPVANFGPVTVTGLESVDESMVRSKIPWKVGDRFDADQLARAQTLLAETSLFGAVQLTPSTQLDDDGLLPIAINVIERRHRTVSISPGYSTDESLSLRASWEHRNLFGSAEYLGLSTTLSGIGTAAEADYTRPLLFGHPDRSLNLNTRLGESDTDAYHSRSLRGSAIVKQVFPKGFSLGGGLGYKRSKVEQLDEEETYELVYVPLILDWHTSDDLLAPTRGGRLNLELAPYYGVGDTDTDFTKGRLSYSRYFSTADLPQFVLAGRAMIGIITGASRDAIPPDDRFYAGGGGSIRGYSYQTVAPLDGTNPIGGRSLLEFSAELRAKLSEKISLIPFVDAGNAFSDSTPDFSADLFWSAGIGLQYFTPIGPLRLDVALPLDKRDEIDDSYQIYLGLGHSF